MRRRSLRWSLVVSGALAGVLAATTVVLLDRSVPGTPVAAGATAPPADDCGDARTPMTVVTPEVFADAVRLAAGPLCLDAEVRVAGGRAGAVASLEPDVDVWITDSRLWAMTRTDLDPATGVSVASSPIVMAVGEGIAGVVTADGAPGASWGIPLKRNDLPQLSIGLQDPVDTAVGLLAGQGVLTVAQAVVPDQLTALSATAAGLQQARVIDGAVIGPVGPTEIVFTAEYAAGTATGARVLRGREGEPTLDFPAYVVTADDSRRQAATDLVTTLASPAADQVRAKVSLRDPDGTAQFPTTTVPVGAWLPVPDPETALRLFGLAQSGSVPSRSLVAVDVSGSMVARQPDGATLMQVVQRSALVALSALPDHSAFGLWEFSSEIEGERDHRVLMPITRLAEGRAATADAVRRLAVVPDGATGLYDTILAQYKELQAGYDPNAQQYLVVLTDGKNENDRGLELDGLLDELRRIQDPAKPISLVAIGYGAVDVALLQRIADVMTGSVYAVRAPEQIVGVLIDAIGRAHTTL